MRHAKKLAPAKRSKSDKSAHAAKRASKPGARKPASELRAMERSSPAIDWDDSPAKQRAPAVNDDSETQIDIGKLTASDARYNRLLAASIGVHAAYKTALGGPLPGPSIELLDKAQNASVRVREGTQLLALLGQDAGKAGLWIGGDDKTPGRVVVRAGNAQGRILLDAANSSVALRAPAGELRGLFCPSAKGCSLTFYDDAGKPYSYLGDFDGFAGLALGGANRLPGRIVLRSGNYEDQVVLDAATGDITLMNADCAEEFDVSDPLAAPGTVLVFDEAKGGLTRSATPYDTKVAGVISGAGGYKPGIVLDRRKSSEGRHPVALMGKVYCNVEADSAPVYPGTLLTTSAQPGCAMAATDRERAFGAVLGKALGRLEKGSGQLPVLVTLQ